MAQTNSSSDYQFTGLVDMSGATTVNHKAASITDAAVQSTATIKAGRHQTTSDFGIDTDAAPSAKTPTVFVARAAGTIDHFYAGLTGVGTGAASSSFDILKNGTTCMSGGTVDVTAASHSARQNVAGTLTTTTFVAGDVFTFDLNPTDTTGSPVGPFAVAQFSYTAEAS